MAEVRCLPEKTGGRPDDLQGWRMPVPKKLDLALRMYTDGLATLKLPVLVLLSQSDAYMLPMVRVAEATGVTVATLSESSKVWERAGVITRVTPASDMRSVSLRITNLGITLVDGLGLVKTPA